MCKGCGKRKAYSRGLCKSCYEHTRRESKRSKYCGPIRCGDTTGGFGFVWGLHHTGEIEIYHSGNEYRGTEPYLTLTSEEKLRATSNYRPNECGTLLRPAIE